MPRTAPLWTSATKWPPIQFDDGLHGQRQNQIPPAPVIFNITLHARNGYFVEGGV